MRGVTEGLASTFDQVVELAPDGTASNKGSYIIKKVVNASAPIVPSPLATSPTVTAACAELSSIAEVLVAKNLQYGDSATNPIRVFSRAAPDEQLRVRIDDKLSRFMRGSPNGEAQTDTVRDLIGYLALWLAMAKDWT